MDQRATCRPTAFRHPFAVSESSSCGDSDVSSFIDIGNGDTSLEQYSQSTKSSIVSERGGSPDPRYTRHARVIGPSQDDTETENQQTGSISETNGETPAAEKEQRQYLVTVCAASPTQLQGGTVKSDNSARNGHCEYALERQPNVQDVSADEAHDGFGLVCEATSQARAGNTATQAFVSSREMDCPKTASSMATGQQRDVTEDIHSRASSYTVGSESLPNDRTHPSRPIRMLHVSNISQNVDLIWLKSIFTPYGRICDIVLLPFGPESWARQACIEFASPSDAIVALHELDGAFVDDREIRVELNLTTCRIQEHGRACEREAEPFTELCELHFDLCLDNHQRLSYIIGQSCGNAEDTAFSRHGRIHRAQKTRVTHAAMDQQTGFTSDIHDTQRDPYPKAPEGQPWTHQPSCTESSRTDDGLTDVLCELRGLRKDIVGLKGQQTLPAASGIISMSPHKVHHAQSSTSFHGPEPPDSYPEEMRDIDFLLCCIMNATLSRGDKTRATILINKLFETLADPLPQEKASFRSIDQIVRPAVKTSSGEASNMPLLQDMFKTSIKTYAMLKSQQRQKDADRLHRIEDMLSERVHGLPAPRSYHEDGLRDEANRLGSARIDKSALACVSNEMLQANYDRYADLQSQLHARHDATDRLINEMDARISNLMASIVSNTPSAPAKTQQGYGVQSTVPYQAGPVNDAPCACGWCSGSQQASYDAFTGLSSNALGVGWSNISRPQVPKPIDGWDLPLSPTTSGVTSLDNQSHSSKSDNGWDEPRPDIRDSSLNVADSIYGGWGVRAQHDGNVLAADRPTQLDGVQGFGRIFNARSITPTPASSLQRRFSSKTYDSEEPAVWGSDTAARRTSKVSPKYPASYRPVSGSQADAKHDQSVSQRVSRLTGARLRRKSSVASSVAGSRLGYGSGFSNASSMPSLVSRCTEELKRGQSSPGTPIGARTTATAIESSEATSTPGNGSPANSRAAHQAISPSRDSTFDIPQIADVIVEANRIKHNTPQPVKLVDCGSLSDCRLFSGCDFHNPKRSPGPRYSYAVRAGASGVLPQHRHEAVGETSSKSTAMPKGRYSAYVSSEVEDTTEQQSPIASRVSPPPRLYDTYLEQDAVREAMRSSLAAEAGRSYTRAPSSCSGGEDRDMQAAIRASLAPAATQYSRRCAPSSCSGDGWRPTWMDC